MAFSHKKKEKETRFSFIFFREKIEENKKNTYSSHTFLVFVFTMIVAVLLGAGSGNRFGKEKISIPLAGKPLFLWSVWAFSQISEIEHIFLVVPENQKESLSKQVGKSVTVLPGGESRFESAKLGISAAKEKGANIVLFHNVANPLVTKREIMEVISATKTNGAAGVARPITSTLRKEQGGVLPREQLWEMETPQGLQTQIFEQGCSVLSETPTDDIAVAEATGISATIIVASPQNRKVTFPEDALFLESFFTNTKKMRVGIGQDSHQFSTEGTLILGGIAFPDTPKLLGNSDGDAILHALTNAISSAIGGGSLSTFSDNLCQQGRTDSRAYLEHILEKLWKEGGIIENISLSIEAKRPKLEQRFGEMKQLLAECCHISPNDIGITATSGEELSEYGKGKGIFVTAVVQLSLLVDSSPIQI